MAITYPKKVQGGDFYLGNGLKMDNVTVEDNIDSSITKTFNELIVDGSELEIGSSTKDAVLWIDGKKYTLAVGDAGAVKATEVSSGS